MQRNPLFLFLSIMTLIIVFWHDANASDDHMKNIAIVDLEMIMEKAEAAKDAVDKITKKRDDFQKGSKLKKTRKERHLKVSSKQLLFHRFQNIHGFFLRRFSPSLL